MHGVRRRQVQERYWIYQLQQLPGGLELVCAEYGFGRLHLHCGLVGAEWRAMHGVRRWQVQEHGRIKWLRRLSGELELALTEYGFGRLHLSGGLVGA